ncbi:MAG: type I pullulanase, partial [Oscillospiraceae bacterium]|nr:type I pullulanase [Oscillospiraceae bacterium]
MNPSSSTNSWDYKWNQTGDLTVPTNGNNCYTMNSDSWDTGTWGTYSTTVDYYLIGYINGANYGCEEDSSNMGSYKFENGKLTATFASDSYVFIKTSNNANWYMTEGYQTGTSATLYNTSSGLTDPNKLFVPGNVEITFTLNANSDGTLTLSYVTNTCEHSYSSVVTTAPTCSAAGVKTYTCTACGSSYTESIAATGHSYTNGVCSVCGYSEDNNINIHFVNTLGWQGVVGYSWVISGSTTGALNGVEWPGQIVQRDADGSYTMELEYEPVSGESLGIIFHDFNGNQTADVTLDYATLSTSHEIWVKPSTTANSDGKYDCTVATSESGMVISPEINGTSVTFRYQNSNASAVYLAGTMNDWSTSATKMTMGADGCWSVTMTLEPGVYEYKFVADGEWYLDPSNGVAGGYDGNSVLVVPTDDETTNTGKITVVLHFYRSSGDYTDWNVWFWGSEKSGSADFQTLDGDKGMIATFTVDGSVNSNVGYIVRKGDWEDQEFYDRFIDLSDVVSGTVHYYVNSGVAAGSRILGEDVVFAAKPSYANYNYDTGAVWLKTTLPLSSALAGDFKIVDSSGNAVDVTVTDAALDGNGYTLTLSRSLSMSELNSYQVKYGDYYATISINTHDLFYSSKFAEEYTYYGDDLGAAWSETSTTFKVWAPTAQGVAVKIYASGTYANNDELKYVNMTQGEKGVWSVTVSGDWSGKYYNYVVTFPTYTVEATDPYAVSTGANGDRGMILNMDTTDPEGWENDISPNAGMNYTDAIIYEMHIREFTIDSSSGVKDAWKGKYLGLTQSGTNYNGYATGLEHLKELGVTHVQLMPVYDYNSVDEYHLTDWAQYAWGYDPKNYNVPEGSYSTDPFDGSVRVTEFKEMVQTLHENGINVVMDVVYNHAFDGGNFCYNKIVPNYFSRFYGEGNWSNGSGVGNDLATERSMARNYIVDSILHWVEEYHIDGFRFDLAGLIDTQTINEIVNTVHAKYPYVIFYGEGWAPGGTAVEYGYDLTTQGNAWMVGGFGFFSDTFREVCVPNSTSTWGFATGSGDVADAVARYMRASTDWTTTPSQLINYTSCHDNYCLTDKIIMTRGDENWYNMTSMNRLSAAMILLSQGVPFIYSGDELLREKKDSSGNRYHNGYGASDEVTKIYWSDLANKDYSQLTDDYYAGLIEFRKNHAALRSPNGADIWNNTTYTKISNNCIMLYIKGGFNYECSSGIVILLNSGSSTAWVDLYDKIPSGYWQACIHGSQAGVDALWGVDVTSSSGNVGVDPYSATVLVLGNLVHEQSVYNTQAYLCSHDSHNTSGLCTSCGANVEHSYSSGSCTVCGLSEDAPETFTVYYDNSSTNWSSVNIYAWTNAGGRTVEYTDSWSGSAMTLVGDNIYSYELPIGATNVIFNDGGDNQTDDLTAPAYNSGVNMYSSVTSAWTTYEVECVHSWKDATCTEAKTCTLCGETEGSALGHSYNAVVTAPTCVAAGYTTHTCGTCGDSYTDSETPATGVHTYVDGSCTGCGAVEAVPAVKMSSVSLALKDEVKFTGYFTIENIDASTATMGLMT